MLRTRVFPCLLLKGDTLVKTVQFRNPQYIGDPINTVIIYNKKEVDELAFLDISATNSGRSPPFSIISDIANECFMPFAYGGGIRKISDIKQLFRLGVEKVIINTRAVEDPSFIKQASEKFGSQSIIISIDAKKVASGRYEVFINSGTKATGLDVVEFARKVERLGAGEIFLNSIDNDGIMKNYDIELIKLVSSAVSIPVIACGGAGEFADIGEAKKAGADAVSAGSIFLYHGRSRSVLINFPTPIELKEILEE